MLPMAKSKLLSRQPIKTVYLLYFAISILVQIPFWFLVFLLFPARRPRPAWSLKRAMIVRTFQELFTIRIEPSAKRRDPLKEVLDSSLKDAKFCWIPPLAEAADGEPSLLCGELRRVAEIAGVRPTKIAGYWLLKKGAKWEGEKAKPGEKTVLHLHGGAFYVSLPLYMGRSSRI